MVNQQNKTKQNKKQESQRKRYTLVPCDLVESIELDHQSQEHQPMVQRTTSIVLYKDHHFAYLQNTRKKVNFFLMPLIFLRKLKTLIINFTSQPFPTILHVHKVKGSLNFILKKSAKLEIAKKS
jgi:hypothetical protein